MITAKIVRKVYTKWDKIAFIDEMGFPLIGPITRSQFTLECFLNKYGYLLDLEDADICPN